MSYRCPECGKVFDEPVYVEGYWEDYNGVSSWFDSRHTVTFAECPRCGEAIDTEYDIYDEDYEYETNE